MLGPFLTALAETTMRTATIRYPLDLSLRIRQHCLRHGLTLSKFFQAAALSYLGHG